MTDDDADEILTQSRTNIPYVFNRQMVQFKSRNERAEKNVNRKGTYILMCT